ncbi:YceI family protein [Pseudomonas sp. ABC1]|uniref:YceI family protein n=1 Tax=Pseudomonas sp. ABC1 TaxID=2748080 RepID=UPI0015C3105D|nr:YceI family protein [Pseudomonas sp. ABC1]QLF91706.1 YceI family protein [Pseudomonas sp. ABC1]
MRFIVAVLLVCSSALCWADWHVLTDSSRVSFVSVKRGNIADVHRFRNVVGVIDPQGAARITLPFADLDSGLALRDERMRELLFEATRFPHAELSANLNLAHWEQMRVGEVQATTLEFQLDLHGHQQRLKAEVLVSRLGEKRMQVTTLEPILIKAELFELEGGLAKLQELAGLPSIASEVPVSAVLDFQQRP